MSPSFTDYILLNLKIFVDEVCSVTQVGHYSADMRRCQNNCIRAFFIEKTFDCDCVKQIEFFMGTTDKVGISSRQQIIPYRRAHQATMSGNVNFTIFIQHLSLAIYHAVCVQISYHVRP